jgi:hypothetical protein
MHTNVRLKWIFNVIKKIIIIIYFVLLLFYIYRKYHIYSYLFSNNF